MKKKGFTLIELLVVIAIIAMLLAILMPALGRVKKMAQRLVCGTNLKGLGNAHNVYAFDYRDEFAVAGGGSTPGGQNSWADRTDDWDKPGKDWSGDDNVTISASLYMLVREADVGPKSFICKSSDEQAFVNETDDDMIELWDFGNNPRDYQSYAYQQPYEVEGRSYPADGTSNPANAIMADKNPWYDDTMKRSPTPSGDEYMEIVSLPLFPSSTDFNISDWRLKVANSGSHDRDGQNILFGDNHVSFEKRPDVGARYDNIYTVGWSGGTGTQIARRKGTEKYQITSAAGGAFSISAEDSMLVSDELSKP